MSETEVTTEAQTVDTDNLDAFADDFFGQKSKPATSQETKEEVVQDEGTQETDAQTAEEDEAELKEEVKDPPKKKTVQDRIDEVVRQREDQKRESERQLAELRSEIEKLKTPVKVGDGGTEVIQSPNEPKPDALDKDGNPIYALGEFDPQYIRDLTRFTLNEERTKVQAETAEAQRQAVVQQEQQALQAGWNTKLETAITEYPDLEAKGRALLNSFNHLDPNYASYLSSVLMTMDKGPDVLYYLSNHPEEATTIVNSGAQRATLALGRIESKFLEADAQKTLAKPKISKAPEPPAERARGTNGAFISVAGDTDDLDDFSQAFFKKK